jgi:hypothetical protein
MTRRHLLKLLTLMMVLALVCGCGGGGGGGSQPGPSAASTVSGTASKGLIRNGTVNIYAAGSNGSRGSLLASVTTDDQGRYSAVIASYNGPIVIEAAGKYLDEATGETKVIEAASPLVAAVGTVSGGAVSVAVTPFTHLAYRKALAAVAGGAAIATAISGGNAEVSTLFDIDITGVQPVDATTATLQGANDQQKAYTLWLAGISELASSGNKNLAAVIDDLNAAGAGANAQVLASVNAFLATNTRNHTGYKRMPVHLTLAGAAGKNVAGLDLTVTLPTDSRVSAYGTGALAPCEYTLHSPTGALSVTRYSAASGNLPATIRIIVIGSELFADGLFATLQLNVPEAVQAGDFAVERVLAIDRNGAAVTGVTLAIE